MNRETTNSYRAQPAYVFELILFGTVVFIAVWPIILLVNAMAGSVR